MADPEAAPLGVCTVYKKTDTEMRQDRCTITGGKNNNMKKKPVC